MELRNAILENNPFKLSQLLAADSSQLNWKAPDDQCAAIHFAAASANPELLEILLQQPSISLDIGNQEQNTPLHVAAACSQLDGVNLLLSSGCNPHVCNLKGKRPIDYARDASIRSAIAEYMVRSSTVIEAAPVSGNESNTINLPSGSDDLKKMVMKLIQENALFQERVQDALKRLIEEKHVALLKCRLMEQAANIKDSDTSVDYVNQLVFQQEQNEKLSAELGHTKSQLRLLKLGLQQQEEIYQKNLNDVIAQHAEEKKLLLQNLHHAEQAFLQYQKKAAKEIFELTTHNTGEGKLDKLGTGISNNYQEKRAELSRLQEQVKQQELKVQTLSEQVKTATVEAKSVNFTEQAKDVQKQLEQMESDRNIQDEKDEERGLIVFSRTEDGSKQIKGATKEKLVDKLTDAISYDSQYQQSFLLTFRAFMKPQELLDLIIARYESTRSPDAKPSVIQPVRLRVVNTVKFWMENYWFDFEYDETLRQGITKLIAMMQQDSPKLAQQLQRSLERKLTGTDAIVMERRLGVAPKPVLPKMLRTVDDKDKAIPGVERMLSKMRIDRDEPKATGFRLMDIEPIEIARQLTLVEYQLFELVKPPEFLEQAWLKDDKHALAPNICAMADWSNHVTKWVISEIVSQDNLKNRIQLFEKFVFVASHLEKLNNFNGITEILAGLQSSAVYRLRKTSGGVSNKCMKVMDDMVKLTSRELNYKGLRARIHATNPPLIPFPGVYLGDLVFLDSGNPSYLENKLINFQKHQKLAGYILELQVYQQTPYNMTPVPEIQDYIRDFSVLDEDGAYNLSLLVEPRVPNTTSVYFKG